ncbi:MAG TPA: hypothetical protein VGF79_13995 [Bacteroidia bacterium]
MKKFLKKTFILAFIPLFVLLLAAIIWDPFKVFWNYEDYYANTVIDSNRELVCKKMFLSKSDHKNVNAFIIGSSRSQAFKVKDWMGVMAANGQANLNGFHFDGNDLGLYRMNHLIRYLIDQTNKIEHILLVLDHSSFKEVGPREELLFKEAPGISEGTGFDFYYTTLTSSLNKYFLMDNIEYGLTGKYKESMARSLLKLKYPATSDVQTGDIFYGLEREIKEDSMKYYNTLMQRGVFYKREVGKVSKPMLEKEQLRLLNEIKTMITEHQIDLRIVISPLYDNIKFNPQDKKTLEILFGSGKVFDYSANEQFTSSIGNYYENSHFRPEVARQILKLVYTK